MASRCAAPGPARLDRTRTRRRCSDRGEAAPDGAVPGHGVRRARRRRRTRITRGRRRAGGARASALARAIRRRRGRRDAAPARRGGTVGAGGSRAPRRTQRRARVRWRIGLFPQPLGPSFEARADDGGRARTGRPAQRPTRGADRQLLRPAHARAQLLATRMGSARHARLVHPGRRHRGAPSELAGAGPDVPARRTRDSPSVPRHALRAVHHPYLRDSDPALGALIGGGRSAGRGRSTPSLPTSATTRIW